MKVPLRLSWSKGAVVDFRPSHSRIVFKDTSFHVSCLDAVDGSTMWEYPAAVESIAVAGGTLFAKTNGESLAMIEVGTGRAEELALSGDLVSVTDDGSRALATAFVGLGEPTVTSSIAVRWIRDNSVLWERKTEGPSQKVPYYIGKVTGNEDVVVANKSDGELECIDFETGELRWAVNLSNYKSHPESSGPGTIRMAPLLSGDECFVWNSHGLFVFDIRSGELRWLHRAEIETRAVSLLEDHVVVTSGYRFDEYRLLDRGTGKLLVRTNMAERIQAKYGLPGVWVQSTPVATAEHVFIGDAAGRLWAFETQTGEPVWFHEPDNATPHVTMRVPEIVGERLFISSFSLDPENPSRLYCYSSDPS